MGFLRNFCESYLGLEYSRHPKSRLWYGVSLSTFVSGMSLFGAGYIIMPMISFPAAAMMLSLGIEAKMIEKQENLKIEIQKNEQIEEYARERKELEKTIALEKTGLVEVIAGIDSVYEKSLKR